MSDTIEELELSEETIKKFRKKLLRYLKDEKPFEHNWKNKTYLLDMLYFMGLAIDEKRFYAAQGFDEFKQILIELINSD